MSVTLITESQIKRVTKRYKEVLDQILELEIALYNLQIDESEIRKKKIKLERERQEIESRAVEGL